MVSSRKAPRSTRCCGRRWSSARRSIRRSRASSSGRPQKGCTPRTSSPTTTARRLDLVHRDVSPHNVLISFDGRVYVTDFGIAKLSAGAQTTTGVVKGKFAYLSPEQASGERLDRRSDVFALGIVFHEALTGERLFDAASPAASVHRLMSGPPAAPHERRSAVPAPLSRVAMRCLERDPARRYATARDVAEALREAIRGEGLHVDERDLAAHVRSALGDERERLRERLAASATPAAREEARPRRPRPRSIADRSRCRSNLRGGAGSGWFRRSLRRRHRVDALARRDTPATPPSAVAASGAPRPRRAARPRSPRRRHHPSVIEPAAATGFCARRGQGARGAGAPAPRASSRPVVSPAPATAAPEGPPLFDKLGP
ncbi:MAG: protein kinase [Byssovorax sp.]